MSRHKRRKYKEYQTPPKELLASALRTLSTLPHDRRADGMRTLAEGLTAIHAGMPLPEFVRMLADLAEREAAN